MSRMNFIVYSAVFVVKTGEEFNQIIVAVSFSTAPCANNIRYKQLYE